MRYLTRERVSELYAEAGNPKGSWVQNFAKLLEREISDKHLESLIDAKTIAASVRKFAKSKNYNLDYMADRNVIEIIPTFISDLEKSDWNITNRILLNAIREKLGIPQHCAGRRILCAIDDLKTIPNFYIYKSPVGGADHGWIGEYNRGWNDAVDYIRNNTLKVPK